MQKINNLTNMAKNLAKALSVEKTEYNDEQINLDSASLLDIEEESPAPERELSELEIGVQNVIFGIKGLINFTQNKTEAEQYLYKFINVFNSNYVVDESDLPSGISKETRLVFVVRLIEALLNLLGLNLTTEQNELVVEIMHFALNTLIEISNN